MLFSLLTNNQTDDTNNTDSTDDADKADVSRVAKPVRWVHPVEAAKTQARTKFGGKPCFY